jgi:hypothetical protein
MKILARTVNITPTKNCHLGGNGPSIISDGVSSELEANLLLIEEYGELKLVVTFDLLYVGYEISKEIRKEASKYLKPECIWLSASHTHNAPHVDSFKPKLGDVEVEYLKTVISLVNTELISMFTELSNMNTVEAKIKISRSKASINRRKQRPFTLTKFGVIRNKVFQQPNRSGFTDPVIRKMELIGPDRKVAALIWNFACHPTGFYSPRSISSHYIGEMRNEVRKDLGLKIPVIFLQGFAGDIRPTSSRKFYEHPVRNIFQGFEFRDFSYTEYRTWINSMTSSFKRDEEVKAVHNGMTNLPFRKTWPSELFVKGSKSPEVILQIFPVGVVYLIGLSCEPISILSKELKNLSQDGEIWPCGYLDDVYGYLPSSEELAKGGYEAGGFCSSFDCEELSSNGWELVYSEIKGYFKKNL